MKIAIAGGTGVIGRHAVRAAQSHGHDAVVLSRSEGVDVLTGAGLEERLRGVDVVVDALNTPSLSRRKAVHFFRTTSRHLLEAGARHGVAHHVVLSIVGIDGIDESYYAGKLAQERTVEASGVPHTIARAAQFHEFAAQISAHTSLGPLTIAPRLLARPVAAREVGEHLLRVAETDPAGRAPDLIGPEEHTLADMIRRMYAHDGTSRRVLEMRLPGAYGRGIASGALRGDPGSAQIGTTTFAQWLAQEHRAG
ncbi:predicted nucleoside-diphosphate sugar epimerase [Brachybacterium faecium DSM 4810]|uniref:Predicted nucleoside-diphosphate sugar epimerase n=1 Tax=Brachybacterium faecium (strain ATCC 43885 / DSM 4810 / JCM 11609 / LMG 19847 / NBRC 14762 / NCIMB 9860 / 6-10) TaxID=446465 RepID=C7MHH6_BRAFD|nr:NAD(P)H-binding protein [Brachybacterium faecium]ACU84385.1 predicted nucleoside-diphosphate sugar epimerase [Brachybacterium faecium DSM 4810]